MSAVSGTWDVVVVGGGHAGAEAALAAARLGASTLLVTGDPATIGRMSCNPAVGGLAKGQVVREIDALGGAMGLVADRTAIQFKVLNASRGPAVRGLRCQSDKALYAAELRRVLESARGVSIAAGTAAGFAVEKGRLAALLLEDGTRVPCRAAVVTTGTFLSGLVHVGETRREAGRWTEPPARALSGRAGRAGPAPRPDEDGHAAAGEGGERRRRAHGGRPATRGPCRSRTGRGRRGSPRSRRWTAGSRTRARPCTT